MSLTKDKITKNAKKYFDTGNKYGFMTDKLMEFLGADFIGAPASTRTSMHNAYEGGLIEHLLKVTKYAVSLKDIVPNGDSIELKSLIKVCCLHQIGKAKLYKAHTSDWHIRKGIMYDFNDELVSMRVGERSAYYAITNGVKFTEEEYQAIVNYDKDGDDKQAKWHTNTLGVILRQANELAILEAKSK